ncbi:MAG: KpsF/GutQ family sugar-phosphate isomerase [Burkholderiales bacterium]|nr:KpsF/GutQ family sugar-phosphate isomerase [Phycisphaerae bacterium]
MDDELKTFAREVIAVEAAAVARMTEAVSDDFVRAARLILDCRASVLTAGIGKAGHIARKVSATLASTGTPSHFISAADAVHGDAGSIRQGDIVLMFSYSGESDELLRLLNISKKLSHPVIAITAAAASSMGRHADVVIPTGRIEEACPLGLAPSASTTAMLALGDALALSVMKLRNFTADDFAIFHPAGQLGRMLIRVSEAMTFRMGENLPVAPDTHTVGQVLQEVSRIKRRSGAVVLIDAASGKISGIFSDGDLRRLVTENDATALQKPVSDVMTRNPKRIRDDALASEAMAMMKQYRVDEIPVVDSADRPVGLIDVQDLVVLKMFDVSP